MIIYDLEWETPSKPFFTKRASYRTSTAPIDLSIHVPTSTIAIADLMKSVSLVCYTPGVEGQKDSLVEIARHFQTTWATACAYIAPAVPAPVDPTGKKEEDSLYLESDAEGNLIVLQRDASSEFAEDKRRLKVVSEMSLGEMVNKIRPIIVATPEAPTNDPPAPASAAAPAESASQPTVTPRAFVATVEGSIYLFGLIAPSKLDLLLRLQSALAEIVQSPGNVPFNRYRAFRNGVREAEEPFRFVDGELVDAFLRLGSERQEEVVRGLGVVGESVGGAEGVRAMVEGLRRLR